MQVVNHEFIMSVWKFISLAVCSYEERIYLSKKERVKSAHNMGKYVGQIKSRINALNNQ